MTIRSIIRIPLILAAFALLPTAAPAQEVATEQATAPEPSSTLKAFVEACPGHKFETTVKIEGRERGSAVRICGEPGQSDAGWLNTLSSSIKATEANDSLSQPVKDQIVAALKTEIARLEGLAAMAGAATDIPTTSFPDSAATVSPSEAAPEYSTLPPLPAPKRAQPRKAAEAVMRPLTAGAVGAPPVSAAPLVRPNLAISCAVPPDRFGACGRLERDSRLLVKANDDLPAGTSLRFVRGGDNRGELELGALKKGESLQEKLPAKLCAGVMRSKVQVQVMAKGQVAETLGPWYVSCD
jgi:hypothetical protein